MLNQHGIVDVSGGEFGMQQQYFDGCTCFYWGLGSYRTDFRVIKIDGVPASCPDKSIVGTDPVPEVDSAQYVHPANRKQIRLIVSIQLFQASCFSFNFTTIILVSLYSSSCGAGGHNKRKGNKKTRIISSTPM